MPSCGLIGTITADTIEVDNGRTFRSVGGILYQAAVLCGLGVSTVLLSHCGESLRSEVEAIVGEWPVLDRRGLTYVPGPGNRVLLRYSERSREREEILESVVPPHDPESILRALPGLDFLFMVFNSGFDISLPDWRAVADRAACPIWVDIHSLVLSPCVGARRDYRAIPDWRDWVEGADYLQANRREAACLMGRPEREADETEIRELCGQAFQIGVRAVFVTLGKEGVLAAVPGDIRRLPVRAAVKTVDPTGCGDVFAAAAARGLLRGQPVFQAASAGVDLASHAAGISGIPETYLLASRAGKDF
ncbi:MAG: PfkB family carbohydrate kinase [Candidatus Aminicenantes bacterium]|nr:PfkB family carbohydrate kinase [Candidatus Aminicenantes bacterium]